MIKTAFIAASLVLSASAANATNDLLDNFHGNDNTRRPVISQTARAAFAAQPSAMRWTKMTPFSREDLSRGAQ